MLSQNDIAEAIRDEIAVLVNEDSDEPADLTGNAGLTDIGMNSLLLARLLIQLEARLGFDPFSSGQAALADVRTVDDLVAAYTGPVPQEVGT